MLIALAKAVGDVYLPPAWEQMIKTTSFNNSEGTPNKTGTIEKEYGRAISAEFERSLSMARKNDGDWGETDSETDYILEPS